MPFVGAEPITVIQRAPGARNRLGQYIVGAETVTNGVLATVNPVPGKVLETLPQGEREGDQRRVITEFELRAPNETTGYPGDHIIYEGDRFEVRDVQVYRQVIPHLEVRVRRINPAETPLAEVLDPPVEEEDP